MVFKTIALNSAILNYLKLIIGNSLKQCSEGVRLCHSNDVKIYLIKIIRCLINLSRIIKMNKINLLNEISDPIEDNKFQQ